MYVYVLVGVHAHGTWKGLLVVVKSRVRTLRANRVVELVLDGRVLSRRSS